jgi:hypothetical protein
MEALIFDALPISRKVFKTLWAVTSFGIGFLIGRATVETPA